MSTSDPPPPSGVSGRRLVLVFALLVGLAAFFATAIWLAARKPWRPGPDLSRPGFAREDVAGQALVQILHTCMSEEFSRAPLRATLIATLLPSGAATLDQLETDTTEGTFAPCARRGPTLLRVAPSNGPPVRLEVRFASTFEPDGTRATRSRWSVLP